MAGTIQKLKSMMSTVQHAGNPQAVFNDMLSQNPQMKQAMDYVQQSGGDARKAFYTLAEQKGVDPEQILSMLR